MKAGQSSSSLNIKKKEDKHRKSPKPGTQTLPEEKPREKTWKKALRWALQIVVIGVIAFFLVMTVVKNWTEIKNFDWHFNPWILAASFLVLLGTIFFMIILWRGLIIRLGSTISLRSAFRIFTLSALGHYVPGKVWQIVGMVYLGRRNGVRTEAGVWAALLAQLLAILSGALVTFGVLLVEQKRMLAPLLEKLGAQSISLWLILLPLALVLALIHPRILEKVTNWILKLFKREAIRFNLSYPGLLLFFLLYIVSWFFYGFAFYLFLYSVAPIPLSDFLLVTGSFAAAYIVGLLALFVPGGLGVREGLIALFLSGVLTAGVAVALSFAQRLWFMCAELTFLLISVIFLRRKNGKEEKKSAGKAGADI